MHRVHHTLFSSLERARILRLRSRKALLFPLDGAPGATKVPLEHALIAPAISLLIRTLWVLAALAYQIPPANRRSICFCVFIFCVFLSCVFSYVVFGLAVCLYAFCTLVFTNFHNPTLSILLATFSCTYLSPMCEKRVLIFMARNFFRISRCWFRFIVVYETVCGLISFFVRSFDADNVHSSRTFRLQRRFI